MSVAKGCKRSTFEDMKAGPTLPRSTVLTEAEFATVVAFHHHTLPPMDDDFHALPPQVSHLTPSALHRNLQRCCSSRLPDVEGDRSQAAAVQTLPDRHLSLRGPSGPLDIAEVRLAEGKPFLFVGLEPIARFAAPQRGPLADGRADRRTAWVFNQHERNAVPCQAPTRLTDHGLPVAKPPRNWNTFRSRPMHFDRICAANGIPHQLTKPDPPGSHNDQTSVQVGTDGPTCGQVERISCTNKDAIVTRDPDDRHDQTRPRLADVPATFNVARRLKTLNELSPCKYTCKIWTSEPDRFILDPTHQMPGMNMIRAALLSLGGIVLVGAVSAQNVGDPTAGSKLAGQCRTCHGINGLAKIPEAPNIGGEPAPYIASQLTAFRDGVRTHEMMTVVAKSLSDQEISDLAAWFGSHKVTAALTADAAGAPGACVACHGDDGIGLAEDVPNLAGETNIYIETQLKAFRNGKRTHEVMTAIASDLTDTEIRAAADWYASVKIEIEASN